MPAGYGPAAAAAKAAAEAGSHALCLDALQHGACRLADADGLASERVPQGCAHGASPGQQAVRGRIGAVLISHEEVAAFVPEEVVECLGELSVVHARVEPAQHRPDIRVRRPVLKAEWFECVVLGVLCGEQP